MSLLDIFRRKPAPVAEQRSEPIISAPADFEEKASAAAQIMVRYELDVSQKPAIPAGKMAAESYQLNPVAFRCQKLISTCCATIPLLLQERQKLVEESPLLDLLARPAPMMSQAHLVERIVSFLMLAGNSYIESVGPESKPPLELWCHRPDFMAPVPGKFSVPDRYEFEKNGEIKRWPVDPYTGFSEILHLREFNPNHDWLGMSRVNPAGTAIDRHNGTSNLNKALIENGAVPSGALVFEPVSSGAGMGAQHAPKELIEKAEKALHDKYTGPGNAGKPMVLGGSIKWEQFGFSPKDMAFDENKQDAAREICNSWGVPHILVVRGDATYNNLQEAKLQLYEETILPMFGGVIGELNHWLTPRFSERAELLMDLDAIPALEYRREARRKSVSNLLKTGVIDANEARQELDYGDRDPNSVRSFDPQQLKALVEAVETIGIEPLHRFMLAHGLIKPGTTQEQLLRSALALVQDDDEDDESDIEEDTDDDDQDA